VARRVAVGARRRCEQGGCQQRQDERPSHDVDPVGGTIRTGALNGPYTWCMKCSCVVMRSSSVRAVCLSTQIVNQAGINGSKKLTSVAARPFTLAVPITCAAGTPS